MNEYNEDMPLSQSNVSLKLTDIQRRCSDLIEAPDDLGGLSLEDTSIESDNSNPYNQSG
jgi:hypothetical protein